MKQLLNNRGIKSLCIFTAALAAVGVASCKKHKADAPQYSCVCKYKSMFTGKDTTSFTDYSAVTSAVKSNADTACAHYQNLILRPYDTAATCSLR